MKIMASNNLDGFGGWGLFELGNTEERGGSSTSFGNQGGMGDNNNVPSIWGGGGRDVDFSGITQPTQADSARGV